MLKWCLFMNLVEKIHFLSFSSIYSIFSLSIIYSFLETIDNAKICKNQISRWQLEFKQNKCVYDRKIKCKNHTLPNCRGFLFVFILVGIFETNSCVKLVQLSICKYVEEFGGNIFASDGGIFFNKVSEIKFNSMFSFIWN
jgi:hypothetical protein